MPVALWVFSATLSLGIAASAQAQDAKPEISLSGRVIRQTREGEKVVARDYAVLHRVTPNKAGPVDSMQTDEKGRFAFRFRPDSGALYLVSAQFGGIAYFSQPAGTTKAPPPADIVVFDTTSADVPLRLQGRHLVVSAPNASGVRSVIDVLEIENDTIVTRIAVGQDRPTFSVLLPGHATNARASQGDGSDAPLTMRDGHAQLFNALSPGLRQIVLTYDLPANAFPIALPLERATGVFEVLLEDTTAIARGASVANKGVVSVDGRSFARFLSQDTSPNAVVTLSVPSAPLTSQLPKWLLPLVLGLTTLGAVVVVTRRAPADASSMLTADGLREPSLATVAQRRDSALELARAAAAVDVLLAARPTSDDGGGDALAKSRASLKLRLRDVLAHGSRES